MTINSIDNLISNMSSGSQVIPYFKNSTASTAGNIFDLFFSTGNPTSGTIPSHYTSSGTTYSNFVSGCLIFSNSNGNGYQYLTSFVNSSTIQGSLILYDRLWSCSGLVLSGTTIQAINTPTFPTRSLNYNNVQAFLSTFSSTTLAVNPMTMYIYYTNQDNLANRTGSLTLTSATTAGELKLFNLQSGDVNIKSIQSFVFSSSLGFTAGSIGLLVANPINNLSSYSQYTATFNDIFSNGFVKIYDDSCLNLISVAKSTTTGISVGQICLTKG